MKSNLEANPPGGSVYFLALLTALKMAVGRRTLNSIGVLLEFVAGIDILLT